MKKVRNKELGILGENLAAGYLEVHGYKVIERNYNNKLGEIDIIAKENNVLCFVEVKTRANLSFGFPEYAVTRAKQRKISQVVLAYLKANQLTFSQQNFRFDVVTVIFDTLSQTKKINLIRNAFALNKRYFFQSDG
ncbi:MAG: YraN family protein [Candidatus Omnitrophota bacterium]|nr:MAG: YraN family protein [Candidatus Omnitrophota bacterium]